MDRGTRGKSLLDVGRVSHGYYQKGNYDDRTSRHADGARRAAVAGMAQAATIKTVTTTADNTTAGDRHGTLREAIANVNVTCERGGGYDRR